MVAGHQHAPPRLDAPGHPGRRRHGALHVADGHLLVVVVHGAPDDLQTGVLDAVVLDLHGAEHERVEGLGVGELPLTHDGLAPLPEPSEDAVDAEGRSNEPHPGEFSILIASSALAAVRPSLGSHQTQLALWGSMSWESSRMQKDSG